MLVSDKYKIVFVCVPKAASGSVCSMIRKVDPKCYIHKSRHAVLNQADADLFKSYFKFAVVRNSYKLCASNYRFMTEKIINERQKPCGLINLIKGQLIVTETSNDWQIREAKNPFPVQLDYFSEKGKILVDKIFYYDKGLDSELSDLKKQIGFAGNLNHSPTSNYFGEYDWKSYYSPEAIEYVKQVCQKDIKYFNFKF